MMFGVLSRCGVGWRHDRERDVLNMSWGMSVGVVFIFAPRN